MMNKKDRNTSICIKPVIIGLIANFGVMLSPASYALNIEFNNLGGVESGTVARAGFEEAALIWENILGDNVTVHLDVGFSPLAPSVLGQAGSSSLGILYSDVKTALTADQTSIIDVSAVANLQSGSTVGFLTTNEFGVLEIDNETSGTNSNNNTVIDVNRANAKALGLLGDDGSSDASITFNSNFNFDFDGTNGITAGLFDFVGIALHEIGHALGFVSGTDTVDQTFGTGNFAGISLDRFRVLSVLDLFRYSEDSRALGFLDQAVIAPDSDSTNDPYFSVDGGTTAIASFSTGQFNGDGRQASHWKDNLGLGILDPTVAAGEFLQISINDIFAFDAIGWDINITNPNPVPVPVPATLLLLGMGLAGLRFKY